MTRLRTALLALLMAAPAIAPAAAPAAAQDSLVLTGTLKTILDRGVMRIGVREAAVPFAFLNKGGQPIGFSVDICHGIAEDVAAALGLDLVEAGAPDWQKGVRIAYVPVAADARLPMVMSGAVDVECGSTTANAERAKTVAFSPVFFLAGTKLMVGASSPAASYRDLAGKTVAVSAGTTNAEVLRKLSATVTPAIAVTALPSVEAGFTALAAGQADALASDDVLLAGEMAAHPGGAGFRIVGDYLSFEPYAIILRKDDPGFSALVQQSFARMASDGSLLARYNRWFTSALPSGETLRLPIGAQLMEMYRAMGQPD